MGLEPLAENWRAFGWQVEEADGHDTASLRRALGNARAGSEKGSGKPHLVIAHTKKGKGVSFMETDYTFHARSPSGAQLAQAREEILNADR